MKASSAISGKRWAGLLLIAIGAFSPLGTYLAHASLPKECEFVLTAKITEFEEVDWNLISDKYRLPIKKKRSLRVQEEGEFSGEGFFSLYTGSWDGNAVFVKFPSRPSNLHQVRLYRILSDLNLGPRFHGITYDAEGRLGIILDYVPGIHFSSFTEIIPDSIHISMQTYTEVLNIKNVLHDIGLIGGRDLQLRITPSGRVFVIDPEFLEFETTKTENAKNLPSMLGQGKSVWIPNETDEILLSLKLILKERGQWR